MLISLRTVAVATTSNCRSMSFVLPSPCRLGERERGLPAFDLGFDPRKTQTSGSVSGPGTPTPIAACSSTISKTRSTARLPCGANSSEPTRSSSMPTVTPCCWAAQPLSTTVMIVCTPSSSVPGIVTTFSPMSRPNPCSPSDHSSTVISPVSCSMSSSTSPSSSNTSTSSMPPGPTGARCVLPFTVTLAQPAVSN